MEVTDSPELPHVSAVNGTWVFPKNMSYVLLITKPSTFWPPRMAAWWHVMVTVTRSLLPHLGLVDTGVCGYPRIL